MRRIGTCWDLVMRPVVTWGGAPLGLGEQTCWDPESRLVGTWRADLLGPEITPACACACTWCAAMVLTAVRHLERKPFLVLAPRLRVTSRRTRIAMCTVCLRWCHEWEASHSLPLGDVTKIYALYACIHSKFLIYYCSMFDFGLKGVVPWGATHEYTVRHCTLLTLTLHCACACT